MKTNRLTLAFGIAVLVTALAVGYFVLASIPNAPF